MTSEQFLKEQYQADAYNSIGRPMVVLLRDGREAVTFVEGHDVKFFDEENHGYALYIQGVDY